MEVIEIREKQNLESFFSDKSGRKILFKFSPVCGISYSTEQIFDKWVTKQERKDIFVAKIDVIFARELSREFASVTGVTHASPQVIVLDGENNVIVETSHYSITALFLDKAIA